MTLPDNMAEKERKNQSLPPKITNQNTRRKKSGEKMVQYKVSEYTQDKTDKTIIS